MAGRIRSADIEEVKRRSNLLEIVGDHVALKRSGADSFKGLCPFHDERSPSFHVRPELGYYHCFGCDASGDVVTFVQEVNHLSFVEAIEFLAARAQVTLTYEEGGRDETSGPPKTKLLNANAEAAQFYAAQLGSEEAATARTFLSDRGFDRAACEQFSVGYAPKGWDNLLRHLEGKGYQRSELVAAGLLSEGSRGVYDRFRGRITWSIRDSTGQVVGFGARKLYEDDQGPKYLNTPESPVYHKSRVLYGLDLAKKAISREHRAVIVEGYTDVMACHLAGIETAVATCGTAFGVEHISVLRRVLGDDAAAEVVFTFDPDEAGKKAALRAFSEEQRFRAQTYFAQAPEGLDPADLRQHRGDAAVREMFERRTPLFEFALRHAISRFDLNSVDGRTSALRDAAPIIAGIKDATRRPAYEHELARMLGVELGEVRHAVREVGRRAQSPQYAAGQPIPEDQPRPAPPTFHLRDLPAEPRTRRERDAVMAMLQRPDGVGDDLMEQAVTAQMQHRALVAVREAMAEAWRDRGQQSQDAGGGSARPPWIEDVIERVPESLRTFTRELAVAPLPSRSTDADLAYARSVVVSLLDHDLQDLKKELLGRLQRLADPSGEEARRLQEQLVLLEQARRSLTSE